MDTVTCPSCGEQNPARFRLCGLCGTSLLLPVVMGITCPGCGEDNPARFRICGICGSWLHGAPPGGAGGPGQGGGHPGGGAGWGPPPWGYWPPPWAWHPQGGYPQGAGAQGGYPPGVYPPGVYPPQGQPPYAPYPQPPHGRPPSAYAQQPYPQSTYPQPPFGQPYPQPGQPPWDQPPRGQPPQPGPYQPPQPGPYPSPASPPPTGAGGPSGYPPPPPPPPVMGTELPVAQVAPAVPLPPAAPAVETVATPVPIPMPPPAAAPITSAGAVAGAAPAPAPAPAGPSSRQEAFPGFDLPRQGAETPAEPATPARPVALPSSEVRKVVTIIFSDLKGSTALTERIDAESINEVKERYFAAMAAEIERHGGKIEKYIGDAIMAVFGLPRAHEDDALRAVRAAHGMIGALARLNEELLRVYGVEIANRTGVNTGEVVANIDPGAEQRLATGDAVNVAARLEQASPANEVLIGEVTYSLVRAHVEVETVEPLELKGKSERVPAYRLIAVRDASAEAPAISGHSTFVGREAELEHLRAGLGEAAGRGGARLVTILGDAGVGKSHLVDAFTSELRDRARVLRGRCLPYGDGITFWPIVEVVRNAAGIVEDDGPEAARGKLEALVAGSPGAADIADRIASVTGLSSSRYPVAEVFWGVRKLLEALGTGRPVVVVIEDVHNAEPTFLDLLEHLLDTTARQAAVLILGTARPLLLEKRAEWASREGTTRLSLAPLDAASSGRLLEELLGGEVDRAVRDRLVGASEGNPLFLEQLVSMLVDKGSLRREADRWVPAGDLADLSVPPTIQALLAARLDDLSREERAIMEPAAVIGMVFPQPAIAELVPAALAASVPGHLIGLDRKQFLHREAAAAGEDEIYRFRNLLIRDATYGSLLKRARAQFHERFVTWAERVNKERNREQEFEEILGYHLEQAYRYRSELGHVDDDARSVARRAAEKLGNAGRRAFGRGDLPAAASLLRRAGALVGWDERAGLEIHTELGEVLSEAGEFAEGSQVLDRAVAAATAAGDVRLAARAGLARLGIAMYAEETDGADGSPLGQATDALKVFETAGDQAGMARAYRVIGSIHATAGQYEAAAEAAKAMVSHAVRAGDTRLASRAAGGYATIARAGSMPAAEVSEQCRLLLEQVQGDRKAEAVILGVIAVAEAMVGNFEHARALHGRAKVILGELGRSIVLASTSIEGARIETLAGDYEAAEALLRADDRDLETMGERYFRSTIVGLLAHAIEAQARLDEADTTVDLAIELADEDDIESQIQWRSARAKIRASQGRGEEALALADEALAMAAETDDIDAKGDVHADYGTVLARLDRGADSLEHFRQARDLYETKGNLALAARMSEAIEQGTRPA